MSMQLLAEDLARFYSDPLGYVMWAFPWGKPNTLLEHHKGPRQWQRNFLKNLGDQIRERNFDGRSPVAPIQFATSSGHGIGKSALTAMLIKFITDTRPFSKGVVTANTSDQLRTKTWAELQKWHGMSITKDLFDYHNTRGHMCIYNKEYKDTWRCDAMTCKEENSEAFAGQHSESSTSYYIFDEASNIPDKISEVAHGGLTDGEPMWFMFGNPTRNTGHFRNAFGKNKAHWITEQIDSREVEGTNKTLFGTWVDQYGDDSDFVRVRVRGLFPNAASMQLIPSSLVDAAFGKHLGKDQYSWAPRIFGLDVARYGDDKSTLYMRQGLAAWKIREWRGIDLMELAGVVAHLEDRFKPDYTFVDVGMGAGVVDRLRNLGRKPIEVAFAGKSGLPNCVNKRAEMWWRLKEWLESGGAIPEDQALRNDLEAQEYTFRGDLVIMVSKEDMKSISGSPDDGDGLALTFAFPVAAKPDMNTIAGQTQARQGHRARTEYNVLAS